MPLTNVAAATQILANALKALDSLREQSKGSKDAALKENVSKLYDSLLDLKAAVLRVEEENSELKAKIHQLESSDGDPCPKCRKRGGWPAHSRSLRMSGFSTSPKLSIGQRLISSGHSWDFTRTGPASPKK